MYLGHFFIGIVKIATSKKGLMITLNVFIRMQITEYCGSYRIAKMSPHVPVADPGFLEMGLICIKVRGFALMILSPYS